MSEFLQDSNWEVKSQHVQLLCSLGSLWHCHWHSQGYLVKVHIQSPIFSEYSPKKERWSKLRLNLWTIWRFHTENEQKTPSVKIKGQLNIWKFSNFTCKLWEKKFRRLLHRLQRNIKNRDSQFDSQSHQFSKFLTFQKNAKKLLRPYPSFFKGQKQPL